MERYSSEIQQHDDLKDENYAQANFEISPLLLHNVILMDVRSYTLKYRACKHRQYDSLINGLKTQIEELQESDEDNDIKKLILLKKCLQDVYDDKDNDKAIKAQATYIYFNFCSSILKKKENTARFDALIEI